MIKYNHIKPKPSARTAEADAWNAVKNGDINALTKALPKLSNISFTDKDGRNLLALCLSELNYNVAIAQLLIDCTIDQDRVCDFGDAMYPGSDIGFLNAPLIFQAYANQAVLTKPDYQVFYALLDNPYIDLNRRFSDTDINPNEMIKPIILEYHSQCYQLENATLLHFLIAYGEIELAKALLTTKSVDVNPKATLYENKHMMNDDSYYAYEKPEKGMLGRIVDVHGGKDIRIIDSVTPLHIACLRGDLTAVTLLKAYNVDFSIKDSLGQLAASYAEDATGDLGLKYPKLEARYIDGKLSKKRYKRRVIFGEADFSYTSALFRKHGKKSGFTSKLIPTEYCSEKAVKNKYPEFHIKRKRLSQNNLTLLFNVDATIFSKHPTLSKHQRYKVIQFNCPHDGPNYAAQTIPIMLRKFFAEAAKKQLVGDRVQMALPDPDSRRMRGWYHGYVYHLAEVSAESGYKIIFKNPFHERRFPGYKHKMTKQNRSAPGAKKLSEFVLIKTELSKQDILDSYTLRTETIKGVHCIWWDNVPVAKPNDDTFDSYTDSNFSSISDISYGQN